MSSQQGFIHFHFHSYVSGCQLSLSVQNLDQGRVLCRPPTQCRQQRTALYILCGHIGKGLWLNTRASAFYAEDYRVSIQHLLLKGSGNKWYERPPALYRSANQNRNFLTLIDQFSTRQFCAFVLLQLLGIHHLSRSRMVNWYSDIYFFINRPSTYIMVSETRSICVRKKGNRIQVWVWN